MTIESSDVRESSPSTPPRSILLTFLVADIRGYTRFTVEHGDEAAASLARRFAEVAEEVVTAHAGDVVELRGDEAFCAFPSARDALRCSLALQGALARAVAADPTLPLKVGMGLDAGEVIPVKGGYRGGALNLAARLCSIAGPGEVFASEGVVHLARRTDGIAFVDRGTVALKGLASPVRVIQIAPEGALPADLPPLQPGLVAHPNNLPDEPTPFIGREREIGQVAGLLRDPHVRMVTLTGPGGTGKTRLALQVGATLLHDFRDGVFFVNLAPLADPALVPSAIAEILGVKEEAGKALLETLTNEAREQHLLLVLDNFEHLLDASTVVAALLDACREVHVLVTSRIPLHLSREHEYPIPSLSVPDPAHLPAPEGLSQYEAVALFIERARAVMPGFAVTNDNAPAVAEICYRLDGLPLAIELAAARIKLFPPQALLQRLSSRLTLLTGGAKDRPSRQQTLRNAIDWSYSLLSRDEQRLFARLSVFAGGCNFEAAEAVCNPEGDLDLLEGISSLIDKSLLRQKGAKEPRFAMLETVREYAVEKLAQEDAGGLVRRGHTQYYLANAERAEADMLRGQRLTEWLDWLDADHDNLREAIHWLLKTGQAEDGLRLTGALYPFWNARGHWGEARRYLEEALRAGAQASAALRAKALFAVGSIAAARQGDYEFAAGRLEEGLTLYRSLGDPWRTAMTLTGLAITTRQREDERWRALYAEALEVLGRVHEIGDGALRAVLLNNLGILAYLAGEAERAEMLFEESLDLARETGHTFYSSTELGLLAHLALDGADYRRAQVVAREGLRVAAQWRYMLPIMSCIDALAGVAASEGEGERAVRLLGAVESMQKRTGGSLLSWLLGWRQVLLDAVHVGIGEQGWARAWDEGQAMSLDEAIAYALRGSA